MPIRHYQGENDTVSSAESSSQTQDSIEQLGGNQTELVTLPNVAHNNMADARKFIFLLL